MARQRLQPVRWTPPPDPKFTGPWEKNEALAGVEVVPVPGEGPEDVAFGRDGTVWTGVEDGRILALPEADPAAGWRTVGNTGGRPGGIEVDADGALVVADYGRGLLRMDPTNGNVDLLADTVDGTRLRCFNNCAVAPDGRIFFSTSSDRWDVHDLRLDAVEHTATGRLLVHDPADGSTEVVLADLAMANGVAMAPDGKSVFVATTAGYDIDRVWLDGPRAGAHEKLVDSLPGMPDNLSTAPDGRIWIAMVVPRNPMLDLALPRHPMIRRAMGALPEAVLPDGPRCMLAVAVDATTGEVVDNLQAWDKPPFHYVTGANEAVAPDGSRWLWLSSIKENAVARHRLA